MVFMILIKVSFCCGLPSDYVSLSTGYSLPVDVKNLPVNLEEITDLVSSMDHFVELNDALDDFLNKVFPIERVREYTLRFLSSCLSGEIREENFTFGLVLVVMVNPNLLNSLILFLVIIVVQWMSLSLQLSVVVVHQHLQN